MNTENWKWFRYVEIFEIKKGSRLTTSDMEIGKTRYIGAIDSNNGVSNYIANNEHIHSGNTISVSYNGSVGYAYYQEKPFWATDDVNVLYPRFSLNNYIALFLCTIIEREQYRYNYGRKWTKELMERSLIKLPSTTDGQPDWQWMEDYAKNTLLPQLPMKTRQVWDKRYNNQPLSAQKLELKVEEWKWFKLPKIFSQLQKCKCSNATELLEEGTDIAYIGAKKNDNGVMQYVQYNADLVTKGHCIVLIGDGQGSVGYSLYQPKDFIGSTTLIAGYSEHLNPYTAQFLVAIIDQDRYRYSFGRKFNLTAINKTMLKLPATTNKQGEIVPDWQWMEDYIKGLPYSGAI